MTALVNHKRVKNYLLDLLGVDPQSQLHSLLRPDEAQNGRSDLTDTEKELKQFIELDELGLCALSTVILLDGTHSRKEFLAQRNADAQALLNLLQAVSIHAYFC